MKNHIFLPLLLALLMTAVIPCAAQVDPILINEPHPNVFDCNNDVFLELVEKPSMIRSTSGKVAKGTFILLNTEILFLIDTTWDGIDKNSFTLKRTAEDGSEAFYPLDYVTSMMLNLRHSQKTFSDPMKFTSLTAYYLIFDVDSYKKDGWTLMFRPTERGGDLPYCEVDIPLPVG